MSPSRVASPRAETAARAARRPQDARVAAHSLLIQTHEPASIRPAAQPGSVPSACSRFAALTSAALLTLRARATCLRIQSKIAEPRKLSSVGRSFLFVIAGFANGCVLLLFAILLAAAGHVSYVPVMAFGAPFSLIHVDDSGYLFAFASVPFVWSLMVFLYQRGNALLRSLHSYFNWLLRLSARRLARPQIIGHSSLVPTCACIAVQALATYSGGIAASAFLIFRRGQGTEW